MLCYGEAASPSFAVPPHPTQERNSPLRIAIFDYKITRNNPIGSCHVAMLRALAAEHDFTVFAVEFENPCPGKIRFIRVPSPTRPLALLFIVYHVMAPVCYLFYRLRGGPKFDLVQALESNLVFGDLLYSHFCHGMYLKHHWSKSGAKGLRGWFRWLDHQLHAWMESFTYPRARQVVVPSRGLAKELRAEFPYIENKLTVLPNPISLDRLQMPVLSPRAGHRAQREEQNRSRAPGGAVAPRRIGPGRRPGLPS